MAKKLYALALPLAVLCLSASVSAEWSEYRVSTRYSGLIDWKLPEGMTSPDKESHERNRKEGFSKLTTVIIFRDSTYTEMEELSPDWLKGSVVKRIHGWDNGRYFNAIGNMGSLGTKEALDRFVPLGQRLLLSSDKAPSKVFKNLYDKGMHQAEGIAQITETKSHMIKAEGGEIHDYFSAGGKWIRIGIYRLTPEGKLVMKRLRPDGSLVSEQIWSQPIRVLDKEAPKPLWERWKVGSYIRDIRVPGRAVSIKWQGPNTDEIVEATKPKRSSGFNLAWLIPGGLLTSLGLVMVAVNSFRRQKPNS